jgi:hypothetical protein
MVALLAVVLVAGCAGDDGATPTDTSQARVYFLRDGQVWPLSRNGEWRDGNAKTMAALDSLVEGPTQVEAADLDVSTAIPDGTEVISMTTEAGVVKLELSDDLSREALAQIVYTATQVPTLDAVEIAGETYTRADFEDRTPSVLVESPLAFEEVTSPLRVTGTANTFEATFSYELTDTDGLIVDENFVTATSGTGTRGTFDFTTKPYTVPFDGVGALIVFEHSAKDGSRINLVEIPLRMTR